MEGRPCHTIYINNINDKVSILLKFWICVKMINQNSPKKWKIIGKIKKILFQVKKVELLRQIYTLASTYGKVIDIMISKAPKLRGQAFVTYKEIADATSAIKRLQVKFWKSYSKTFLIF